MTTFKGTDQIGLVGNNEYRLTLNLPGTWGCIRLREEAKQEYNWVYFTVVVDVNLVFLLGLVNTLYNNLVQ